MLINLPLLRLMTIVSCFLRQFLQVIVRTDSISANQNGTFDVLVLADYYGEEELSFWLARTVCLVRLCEKH